MSTFIIAYDLNRETNRPPIVATIKEIGTGWAKLSESAYAISYGGTPQQVFNKLKPLLDSNDHLYVITLKKPYAGYGPEKVIHWLDGELTY